MALGSSVFRGRKREAIPLKVSPVATEFTAAIVQLQKPVSKAFLKGETSATATSVGAIPTIKTMADMNIVHMEQLAISYC
jgi:hypothetical protein